MAPLHLLDVALRVAGIVTDDHEPQTERPLDLRLVSSDLLAPAAEDGVLVSHELDVAGGVPCVGVLRDGVQGLLLAVATDEDREVLLHRSRIVAYLGSLIAGPARGGLPGGKHLFQEVDGLVEPVQPLTEARTELDPVGLVLALEPGATNTEDRPAVAHVIERRDDLRGESRVAEGVRADHQSERRARGDRRPAGEDHVALKDRPTPIALDWVEVVPRPERVVAELVGAASGVHQGAPVGVLAPRQDASLDAIRHTYPPVDGAAAAVVFATVWAGRRLEHARRPTRPSGLRPWPVR